MDGKRVNAHLWDTAGQDRFRSMTKSYYQGAHGIILVYDCTNEASFANIRKWCGDIEGHMGSARVNKILIGKIFEKFLLFISPTTLSSRYYVQLPPNQQAIRAIYKKNLKSMVPWAR